MRTQCERETSIGVDGDIYRLDHVEDATIREMTDVQKTKIDNNVAIFVSSYIISCILYCYYCILLINIAYYYC